MRKIYFIIPVYKVEKYLARCVGSVIEQSCENTEIILIDDGSPDNCPQICDEYAEKYGNIKVIHKKNGGLSDARNAGLSYIAERCGKEDYIAFLDSDDFIHKDFAAEMISLAETNDCDIVQCGYEKGSGCRFSSAPAARETLILNADEALLGYRLKSQVFAKIFKARIFETLRFPVGMINEDEFVTYRAVYNAEKILITDAKLFYYFQRSGSIMSDISAGMKNDPHRYDYLRAYEERAAFFRKLNKPEQVCRTYEKVCADIILRYCEQMRLVKSARDEDCVNGEYMRIYRESYKIMIKRRAIPLKRRLIYTCFYAFPMSAAAAGRFFDLRK